MEPQGEQEDLVGLALRRMGEILELQDAPENWLKAAALIFRALGKSDSTEKEILDRQLEQITRTEKADQEAGL